jgi:hypothetical protein
MIHYIFIATMILSFLKSYSQNERDFKNQKTLSDGGVVLGGAYNTIQTLTIYDIKRHKSFETKIKPKFQYLYIFRLSEKDFDFDYSNRLRLPE